MRRRGLKNKMRKQGQQSRALGWQSLSAIRTILVATTIHWVHRSADQSQLFGVLRFVISLEECRLNSRAGRIPSRLSEHGMVRDSGQKHGQSVDCLDTPTKCCRRVWHRWVTMALDLWWWEKSGTWKTWMSRQLQCRMLLLLHSPWSHSDHFHAEW